MTGYVHPLRFVNTPTIKEIWEAEHGKDIETESTDTEVKELSDEYDKVSGNEGFYQLFLRHSQKPMDTRALYTGNEGFWEEVKKGVNYVVDSIKKFFKWVYSFFTSKKELVERTKNKMSKIIDIKGVKEGDITYPASTGLIWNATGKPGTSIGWIATKITEVDKVIDKGVQYKDATKNFITAIGTALSKHGQLHKAKPDIDNLVDGFNKKLKEIFHEGPFLAMTSLTVNKENKIVLKRNRNIPQKAISGSFRTDVSTAKTILKAIENANDEYGNLTAENMKLEEGMVKNLELSLRTGTTFSDGDHAAAKAVSEKVKGVMNATMANIKTLENVIHKSINGALGVVKAAVPSDSSTKE